MWQALCPTTLRTWSARHSTTFPVILVSNQLFELGTPGSGCFPFLGVLFHMFPPKKNKSMGICPSRDAWWSPKDPQSTSPCSWVFLSETSNLSPICHYSINATLWLRLFGCAEIWWNLGSQCETSFCVCIWYVFIYIYIYKKVYIIYTCVYTYTYTH